MRYIIPIDEIFETENAYQFPVGRNGNYPICGHVWIPKKLVNIIRETRDRMIVEIPAWKIKDLRKQRKLLDGNDVLNVR